MNPNRSIQIKAAFLLIVFSLNTLIGFACSMGVDMGFNTSHHKGDDAVASVHRHNDGKKHTHNHGETASKKDDCCKEKVVKLQTSDKVLTHAQVTIDIPVFVISSFFQFSSPDTVKGVPQKHVAYQFHPPPRNIRIDIQSFQI